MRHKAIKQGKGHKNRKFNNVEDSTIIYSLLITKSYMLKTNKFIRKHEQIIDHSFIAPTKIL